MTTTDLIQTARSLTGRQERARTIAIDAETSALVDSRLGLATMDPTEALIEAAWFRVAYQTARDTARAARAARAAAYR